jgi:hypothetical protein
MSPKTTESVVKKIVVDSGKFATKAIGRDSNGEIQKIYFETKMDATQETTTNAERSYAIEIDGKRFLIGRIASKNDFTTTKAKELHRNCIYTAIHQLINDRDTVALYVLCPISVFTEKEHREEFEAFLKENEIVELTVNEVRKAFKIASVNVLPESAGYLFKNIEKCVGKMTAVVDIGGLNTNCCIYDGIDMIPGTEFTYNLGANVLRTELKKTLNKKFLANLNDKQVELAIAERKIKKDPVKSEQVINEFLLNHVKTLRDALIENQWDVDTLDFVFVGGGSLLLQEEIKKVFGEDVVISENAIWDNAEGVAELINL